MAGEGTTTTTTPNADGGYTPPEGTATVNLEGYFASDPLADIVNANSDDARVQTYDRYASSNSGAFPSFFPQIVNRKDIMALLYQFNPEQRVRLKQRLWAAGYIKYMGKNKDGTVEENPFAAPPIDASIDEPLINALNNLTHDAATQQDRNGNPYTLDSLINSQIQSRSSSTRERTIAEFDLTAQAEALQSWAQKNIGRDLQDAEIQNLFSIVGASDTSFDNQTRSTVNPFGSPANDLAFQSEPLTGGGADSKAISYLKNLSNIYGTTVLADYSDSNNAGVPMGLREGRGVVLGGNVENLTRLKQWADSQTKDVDPTMGANALFETVQLKYENGNEPERPTLPCHCKKYHRSEYLLVENEHKHSDRYLNRLFLGRAFKDSIE